ncbi:hypothetical protein IW262DRAFT_1434101 [Armillaria fumosa]|nr:hypothetical protein IW262DRAFT_1434101 [Armillaria fumosa]
MMTHYLQCRLSIVGSMFPYLNPSAMDSLIQIHPLSLPKSLQQPPNNCTENMPCPCQMGHRARKSLQKTMNRFLPPILGVKACSYAIGRQATCAAQCYRGHRVLPESILEELEKENIR